MVTTRSKSLGLAANVDVDTAATPARFGRKSKGSSGFDGGYARLATIVVHTFLDLLAFTLAMVFLPDILRHFKKSDASAGGLFAFCETKVESFRLLIGAPSKQNLALFGGTRTRRVFEPPELLSLRASINRARIHIFRIPRLLPKLLSIRFCAHYRWIIGRLRPKNNYGFFTSKYSNLNRCKEFAIVRINTVNCFCFRLV